MDTSKGIVSGIQWKLAKDKGMMGIMSKPLEMPVELFELEIYTLSSFSYDGQNKMLV